MDIFLLLTIQFWTGVIQLSYAALVTLFCLAKFRTIPKSLGTYWLLVLGFAVLLGFFALVSEEVAMVFLFAAWFIALYWFAYFISWTLFKPSSKNE